jgi:hypothetical protein
MDVLYIRRSLAWTHAIVFGHVSEFQHIRVKTNREAARMCIWRLHNAPHRWHMKSGDRSALLAKIYLEAEWASSRLVEVARSSVQLSI